MKTTQTTGAVKFTSKRAAVIAFNKAKNERYEAQQAQAAINKDLGRSTCEGEEITTLLATRREFETAEHVAYNKMFDIYHTAEKQNFHITTNLFGHNATRDLASANCD